MDWFVLFCFLFSRFRSHSSLIILTIPNWSNICFCIYVSYVHIRAGLSHLFLFLSLPSRFFFAFSLLRICTGDENAHLRGIHGEIDINRRLRMKKKGKKTTYRKQRRFLVECVSNTSSNSGNVIWVNRLVAYSDASIGASLKSRNIAISTILCM